MIDSTNARQAQSSELAEPALYPCSTLDAGCVIYLGGHWISSASAECRRKFQV